MLDESIDPSVNGSPAEPIYVPSAAEPRPRDIGGLSMGDGKLSLDEVIAALRLMQTQYNSLRVAEQILMHIVDAKEHIAGLERRKMMMLDEISKLEQRRETALANATAAEQAAKVRIETMEAQVRREEERLNSERKKLESDLDYLRSVVAKLTATASELKL